MCEFPLLPLRMFVIFVCDTNLLVKLKRFYCSPWRLPHLIRMVVHRMVVQGLKLAYTALEIVLDAELLVEL